MSGVWCMDCHAKLAGDEPCPCCTRSVMPSSGSARSSQVHWLRVQTARGLILVRLTEDDLRGGGRTIDLRELT